MRYGMVIDLKRCIGCDACTVACKQSNGTPPDIYWSKVIRSESGQYPNPRLSFLPVLCMHCSDAPCESVCPTGATSIQDNGTVTIDPTRCIGCRYCMAACPYDARSFIIDKPASAFTGKRMTIYEEKMFSAYEVGTVCKCDFCLDRVKLGKDPACVQTCTGKARVFGDLDDPESEVSRMISRKSGEQLYPQQGTDPSVYYLPA